MELINLPFSKYPEKDFKNFIRLFKYYSDTKETIDCRDEYIKEENDNWYSVHEYVLDTLIQGYRSECIGCWTELIAAPKPIAIVNTTFIWANTPLWTTFYEAWIFEYIDYYVAYIVSPRVGNSLTHYVSKYPVNLYSLEEEHVREKLKIKELKEGYCIYCGEELPEEPEYYDYGLGRKGEPNVPVYECQNCGMPNYGFRVGELVKKLYTGSYF